MQDLLCTIELPARGKLIHKSKRSKLTDRDRVRAVGAFGTLSCRHSRLSPSEDRYDVERNTWAGPDDKPRKIDGSGAHATALAARCDEVNAACRQLGALQMQVGRIPVKFLSAPGPSMPVQSGDRRAWRRNYGHWIETANERAGASALSEDAPGWSPEERRFRAAAQVLAALPRPAPVGMSLCATSGEAHYRLILDASAAFYHPGIALRVADDRIEIDAAKTIAAPNHAALLCMSHVAALIASLGRFETDPRTTLDITILIGGGDEIAQVGPFKTANGAWAELPSDMERTETKKLSSLTKHFSVWTNDDLPSVF